MEPSILDGMIRQLQLQQDQRNAAADQEPASSGLQNGEGTPRRGQYLEAEDAASLHLPEEWKWRGEWQGH